MRPGQPTKYSQSLAKQICDRISTSSDGLQKICDSLSISRDSVYAWLSAHDEFSDMYARARQSQCQILADEIIAIADTTQEGTVTRVSEKGTEVRTGDMIEHRRLQVDARKWVLSKLLPKKYGEKVAHEVSGEDGGPIVHTIRFGNGKPDRD